MADEEEMKREILYFIKLYNEEKRELEVQTFYTFPEDQILYKLLEKAKVDFKLDPNKKYSFLVEHPF